MMSEEKDWNKGRIQQDGCVIRVSDDQVFCILTIAITKWYIGSYSALNIKMKPPWLKLVVVVLSYSHPRIMLLLSLSGLSILQFWKT